VPSIQHAFLNAQLENECIRMFLVNGSGVWTQLNTAMQGKFELQHHEIIEGFSHQVTRLDVGRLLGKILVLSWNTNLQSSFGVTSGLRKELARRVALLYATFCG